MDSICLNLKSHSSPLLEGMATEMLNEEMSSRGSVSLMPSHHASIPALGTRRQRSRRIPGAHGANLCGRVKTR